MLQPDFRWLWINFFKTEYNYNMPFWEWSEFYQIQGHPSQKFKKKEDHKWRTCHEKGQQCQLFMPRTRRRASISAAKKHDRGLLWKWQILILMAETWCVENRGCWFLKIRFFFERISSKHLGWKCQKCHQSQTLAKENCLCGTTFSSAWATTGQGKNQRPHDMIVDEHRTLFVCWISSECCIWKEISSFDST